MVLLPYPFQICPSVPVEPLQKYKRFAVWRIFKHRISKWFNFVALSVNFLYPAKQVEG
jgi:hypothetical protein